MSTLIEISENLLAFKSLLDGCDGDITPEVEQAMEKWFGELGAERDAKLDNYAGLIRELTLRASARKEEMDRLAMRVHVDNNTVAKLKERLKVFMQIQGEDRIETRRYRLSVCGNGGRAELDLPPVDSLPDRYKTRLVVANQTEIREALKRGETIDGVRELPRGTHLRIA